MAKKRESWMSAEELADRAALGEFHPKNMDSFYSWDNNILVLNILGTPNAKRDVIGKPKGNQLQISVTANPIRGNATGYMVRWLAKEFDVKLDNIEVVFGRANVNKQIRITEPKKLLNVIVKAEEKQK